MVSGLDPGGISSLNADEHHDLQELLPWYVTGRLDEAEQARVDAHVSGCAECQAEVRFQRRLEAEVARLPIDVEEGWASMRRQVEADQASTPRPTVRRAMPRAAWMGWGIAASLAVVSGVSLAPRLAAPYLASDAQPGYHALSAAPAPAGGNVIVIFRPDATEAVMRETLRASHARLVDGPTTADAYVLSVDPKAREAALANLRARREVVLAEPVDTR